MKIEELQYFLEDYVEIMIDKLEDIQTSLELSSSIEYNYVNGQIMGYYIALDTLKTQASAFQIKICKLDNINLEKYLYK